MLDNTGADLFSSPVDLIQLIDVALVGVQRLLIDVINACLRAKGRLSVRYDHGLIETEKLLAVLIRDRSARIYCLHATFLLRFSVDHVTSG